MRACVFGLYSRSETSVMWYHESRLDAFMEFLKILWQNGGLVIGIIITVGDNLRHKRTFLGRADKKKASPWGKEMECAMTEKELLKLSHLVEYETVAGRLRITSECEFCVRKDLECKLKHVTVVKVTSVVGTH